MIKNVAASLIYEHIANATCTFILKLATFTRTKVFGTIRRNNTTKIFWQSVNYRLGDKLVNI